MDDADHSVENQELHIARSLKRVLDRPSIPFSGQCLHCDDSISIGRFCDSNCRELYEKSQKRQR